MTVRAALTAGTAASVAVTAAWSWTATLTIGPAPLPRFGRSLTADYAALAAAPTGSSPVALFAVAAALYALCFLASGLRARRRTLREAITELDDDEYAEPAMASARRWRR